MSELIKELDEQIEILERLINRQEDPQGLQALSKDLKRERLSAFREVRDLIISEQPTLDKNQQPILGYLKHHFNDQPTFLDKSIFKSIDQLLYNWWDEKLNDALYSLDLKQQAQVLQVFIQWALEQENAK